VGKTADPLNPKDRDTGENRLNSQLTDAGRLDDDDETALSSDDTIPPASSRPFVTGSENADLRSTEDQAADDADEDEAPEVAEVRAQIEQTRAEMSQTIDAIKDRLSPAHLVAEAKEAVKETAKAQAQSVVGGAVDMAKGAATAARDAVAGVVESAKGALSGAAESAKDALSGAADTTKDKLGDVSDSMSGVAHNATDVARDAGYKAKEVGAIIVETIKMNPLPAAIAGIGLGWLLMSAQRQRHSNQLGVSYRPQDSYNSGGSSYDRGNWSAADATASGGIRDTLSQAGHKVSEAAGTVKEKAGDVADSVKEKAGDVADTVKEKAGDVSQMTREKAQEAWGGVDRFIHDQPLAAGALALLVGAAIGLAVPSTSKENQIMGETRDRLAEKASDAAHDLVDKVQHVAQEAISTAKDSVGAVTDSVKEEARNQGLAPV